MVRVGPGANLELGMRLIQPEPCRQLTHRTHVTETMIFVTAIVGTIPLATRKGELIVSEVVTERFQDVLAGLAMTLPTIGGHEQHAGCLIEEIQEPIDEKIHEQSQSYQLSLGFSPMHYSLSGFMVGNNQYW